VILVDTSIWVDHFRAANPLLDSLLINSRVLTHPFVIGELAIGSIRRETISIMLGDLPHAISAGADEVLDFIWEVGLSGSGIGYVDAHLLAAARLTPEATIWTRDRRLAAVAGRLGLAARPHDA
jgi:predicted nucleic acid-binding protein